MIPESGVVKMIRESTLSGSVCFLKFKRKRFSGLAAGCFPNGSVPKDISFVKGCFASILAGNRRIAHYPVE